MAEETAKALYEYETVGEEEPHEKHKPHFSVKMNGNFVGSAWLSTNKFGKYVSLAINHDVPKGSRVNVYPNKQNSGILG